jgi:hypothetical protein
VSGRHLGIIAATVSIDGTNTVDQVPSRGW